MFKLSCEELRNRLAVRSVNAFSFLIGKPIFLWMKEVKVRVSGSCYHKKSIVNLIAKGHSRSVFCGIHRKLLNLNKTLPLHYRSHCAFFAVQPKEVEWLSILANIAPAKIVREESALRDWAFHTQRLDIGPNEPKTEFSIAILGIFPQCKQLSGSKDTVERLLECDFSSQQRSDSWSNGGSRRLYLTRRTWLRRLRLNRNRTGQWCCAFLLNRWNIIESPLCQCGEIQTMIHLVDKHRTNPCGKRWSFGLAKQTNCGHLNWTVIEVLS